MSRYVACGVGVLAMIGCVSAPAAALQSGVDLKYVDHSVRPQDDLYRYLNGKWLDSFQLPADKGSYGSFTYVDDTTQEQLRAIETVDDCSQLFLSRVVDVGERPVGTLVGRQLEAVQPLAVQIPIQIILGTDRVIHVFEIDSGLQGRGRGGYATDHGQNAHAASDIS